MGFASGVPLPPLVPRAGGKGGRVLVRCRASLSQGGGPPIPVGGAGAGRDDAATERFGRVTIPDPTWPRPNVAPTQRGLPLPRAWCVGQFIWPRCYLTGVLRSSARSFASRRRQHPS